MGRQRGGGAEDGEPPATRVRGQQGLTLTESLIALFLVSTIVLALAAGMFTFLRTTRATSEAQKRQAELTRLAETIKAADFVPCDIGDPVAAYASVTGLPPAQIDVEFLAAVPTTVPTPVADFVATCPATDRVQRVTLTHDGASAQIVKRYADRSTTTTTAPAP